MVNLEDAVGYEKICLNFFDPAECDLQDQYNLNF